MTIFARNQLNGAIVEIVKGSTTAHVKLDVGGAIVTLGDHQCRGRRAHARSWAAAYAVVKASDVMIAID